MSKSLVAVAARQAIVVYELYTENKNKNENVRGKSPVITIDGMNRLRTIALSKNDDRMCAGTGDGKLLIWEMHIGCDIPADQNPKEISLRKDDNSSLRDDDCETRSIPYAVAFSSDGSRICAGLGDRYIHVYKLENGGWLPVEPIRLKGNFVSIGLPLNCDILTNG